MKTIKEVKELYEGEYAQVEVYKAIGVGEHYPNHFHTDNCNGIEESFDDESEVGLYELMDEDDYNDSILANSCMKADFEEWYGSKDAKVLCMMLAD